jgi:hypothetical protein
MPLEIYPPFLGPATPDVAGDATAATEIESRALWLLAEATDTKVSAVGNNTGTESITTTAYNYKLMNEGLEWMCRTCLYIPCLASKTNLSANTNYVSTFELTVDTSGLREMWYPEMVLWDNTGLTHSSSAALRRYDPNFENTAAGTPTHWFHQSRTQIGLYKKPSANGNIAVYGAGYPSRLGDGTGTTVTSTNVAASSDLLYILPRYVALMIAKRNYHDASLVERVPLWEGELVREATRLWGALDARWREPGAIYQMPPSGPVTGNRMA